MDEKDYDEYAKNMKNHLQLINEFMSKNQTNPNTPTGVMEKLNKLYKCTEKKSLSIEFIMKVEKAIERLKDRSSEKTVESSNYKESHRRTYRKATRDKSRSRSGSRSGWYENNSDCGYYYDKEKKKPSQGSDTWDDSDEESPFELFPNKISSELNDNASMSSIVMQTQNSKFERKTFKERLDHRKYERKKVGRFRYNDRSSRTRSPLKSRSRSKRYRTRTPDRSGYKTDRNRNEKSFTPEKSKTRKSRSPSPDEIREDNCRLDFKNDTYAPSPRYLPLRHQDDYSFRNHKNTKKTRVSNDRDSRSRSLDQKDHGSEHHKNTEKLKSSNARYNRSPSLDNCRLNFNNDANAPSPRYLPIRNQNNRSVSPYETTQDDGRLKSKTEFYSTSPDYSPFGSKGNSSSGKQQNKDKCNSSYAQETRPYTLDKTTKDCRLDLKNSYTPPLNDLSLSRQDNRHQEIISRIKNIIPSSTVTSGELYKESSNIPTIDLTCSPTIEDSIQVSQQQTLTKRKNSFCLDEDIINQIIDQSKTLVSNLNFDTETVKKVLATARLNQNIASTINDEDTSKTAKTFQLKDLRLPNTEEPRMQDLGVQESRVKELRFQEPRIEDPRIQNPRIQDPRIHDPHIQDPRIREPRIVVQEDFLRLQQSSISYHQPFQSVQNYIRSPYPKPGLPLTSKPGQLSTLKLNEPPSPKSGLMPTPRDFDPKMKPQNNNVQIQDHKKYVEPKTYGEYKRMRETNTSKRKNTSQGTATNVSSKLDKNSTTVPTKSPIMNVQIPKKQTINRNHGKEESNVIHFIDWEKTLKSVETQSTIKKGGESNNLVNGQESVKSHGSKTKKPPQSIERTTKRSMSQSERRTGSKTTKKPSQIVQSVTKPSSSSSEPRNRSRSTTKATQANETIKKPSSSPNDPLKSLRNRTKASQDNEDITKASSSRTKPQTCSKTMKEVSQANENIKKNLVNQQKNDNASSSLVDETINVKTITALKELMSPNKLLALVDLMGQLSNDTALTKVKEILRERAKGKNTFISNHKDSENFASSTDSVKTDGSKTMKKKYKNELEKLFDDTAFIRGGAIKARDRKAQRNNINAPIEESSTERNIQTKMGIKDRSTIKSQKTQTRRARSISPVSNRDKKGLKPGLTKMRRERSKSTIEKAKAPRKVLGVVTRSSTITKRKSSSGINNPEEPRAKRVIQSQFLDDYNEKTERTRQENNELKQTSGVLKKITKNNNPEWHSLVKIFNCLVCDKSPGLSIVSHYVNEHPLSEVISSRLAPDAAKLFRSSGEVNGCKIVRQPKDVGYQYKQFCFFCNINKCFSRSCWIDHISRHTGYYQYECADCSRKFCLKNRQHVCQKKNHLKNIPQPQLKKPNIIAYVCDLCNFVRFHKKEIFKHLNCEHEDNITKSYTEGIFLKFPKRKLKSEVSEESESFSSEYEEEEADEDEIEEEEVEEEDESSEEDEVEDEESEFEESELELESELDTESDEYDKQMEEQYEKEIMESLEKELTEEMNQDFEKELQEYEEQLDNGEFNIPENSTDEELTIGCEVEITDDGEIQLTEDCEIELSNDCEIEQLADGCNDPNEDCDQLLTEDLKEDIERKVEEAIEIDDSNGSGNQ